MQQYLFRGKRKDNSEWVEGSLIDKDYILKYIDLAESWTPLTSDHKITCRAYEVIPETVGMWTGFTDKHAKKIFEGDALQGMMGEQARDRDHYSPIESVVEFKRGGFEVFSRPMSSAVFGAFHWCDPASHANPTRYWKIDEWEVVGSIHDEKKELVNPTAKEQL